MKKIEITLKSRESGDLFTYKCHTYTATSNYYILEGVKGHTNYGMPLYFDKVEWERVK